MIWVSSPAADVGAQHILLILQGMKFSVNEVKRKIMDRFLRWKLQILEQPLVEGQRLSVARPGLTTRVANI